VRSSASRCIVVVILIAALAGCTSAGRTPAWTYAPASAPAADAAHAVSSPAPSAPAGVAAAPSTAPAGGNPGTLEIRAFDLGFQPNDPTVPTAGHYHVTFANDGATTHDITFADGTKIVADAGQTGTAELDVPAAGLAFICSIPGHADAGMKGSLAVGDGAMPGMSMPPASTPPATTADAPVADPAAPAYSLFPAAAPALLPGTVHDIDLPIIDKDITVASGFVVHAWTFGGTVPGPTIRVHLGDTVRVHLTNQGAMSHSIDFHASQTAMNHQMVEIAPGKSFTYTFTADYAGVWMYHCGTAPALHHIANGMYGMVIVEPEGGLPKVDQEVAIVQSEWYLGAQKQPVDYAKANAAAPAPDFVVFNGVANQYKDNPIQVTTKGRVRAFVLNVGPNVDSSFHVVGTIFDTVRKEGVGLVKGNADGWGSQAVDLAPAQGAIIEFSPQEDGMYPMVTHAFNFVGRGAIGIFLAGDGDPTN
jgi:nitrite reductase (NO-forming)